jgi:hypothetical protein
MSLRRTPAATTEAVATEAAAAGPAKYMVMSSPSTMMQTSANMTEDASRAFRAAEKLGDAKEKLRKYTEQLDLLENDPQGLKKLIGQEWKALKDSAAKKVEKFTYDANAEQVALFVSKTVRAYEKKSKSGTNITAESISSDESDSDDDGPSAAATIQDIPLIPPREKKSTSAKPSSKVPPKDKNVMDVFTTFKNIPQDIFSDTQGVAASEGGKDIKRRFDLLDAARKKMVTKYIDAAHEYFKATLAAAEDDDEEQEGGSVSGKSSMSGKSIVDGFGAEVFRDYGDLLTRVKDFKSHVILYRQERKVNKPKQQQKQCECKPAATVVIKHEHHHHNDGNGHGHGRGGGGRGRRGGRRGGKGKK